MKWFSNYKGLIYGDGQDKNYDYFIEQLVNDAGHHNSLWYIKPKGISFTHSDGSKVQTVAIFKIKLK